MKGIARIGFIIVLLQAFAYAQDGSGPADQMPTTKQVVGSTEARIAAAYFPAFENFQNSTNSACQTYLEKTLSGARIDTISTQGDGTKVGTFSDSFELIDGLVLSYNLPESYRTSAKLMVTWTVRIEGKVPERLIRPQLCKSWSGTVTEACRSNMVHTQLYVNGAAKGQKVTMEVPEGTATLTQNPPPPPSPSGGGGSSGGGGGYVSHAAFFAAAMASFKAFDPTLVGTYVLTAQDFGGTFPATLEIEIRWVNESGMTIVSPKEMRSMIVNYMPVSKAE